MSPAATYLEAALLGDRERAYATAGAALRDGWSLAEIHRDMRIRCQHDLGELWAASRISVAQQHMASAVTASVLARLYEHMPSGRPRCGRALIAGVEVEHHSLPARFAADQLELEGWDVLFVGTRAPQDAVVALVELHRPDLLGLSVTMVYSLEPTISMVKAVRSVAPTLRIVLGGRAVRDQAGLAHQLGVELAEATGEVRARTGGLHDGD